MIKGTYQILPEELAAAVDCAGEAILITSADLDEPGPTIRYVNPAFSTMTGYPASEIVGRSPRLLQGPSTDRSVLLAMRAALQAGNPFQGETVNYRKDGTPYVVEWMVAPVRSKSGQVVRWVSAQRDVTEKRRSEERQSLLVRRLHQSVTKTLATVQAAMDATAVTSVQLPEFRQAFESRIASIARTHALIAADADLSVSFDRLLRAELDIHANSSAGRIDLHGPDVALPSELAVPIGMVLHELSTAAARLGALAGPDGRLEVRWAIEDRGAERSLRWTWTEHDGPPGALQAREGFEMTSLKRLLEDQFSAKVDVQFDPDGLRVDVCVPLPLGERERSDGSATG